jgi:predicted nuclease of predicted toxin-antitoxin system
MRWLVDECVDAGLVGWLRRAGHDVFYAVEMASARSDSDLLILAQTGNRLLLTEDKDFGDLVFRRGGHVPGLVLSRIDPAMHVFKRQRLDAAIVQFGERMIGHYTIIEPGRFRSRPLRKIAE